MRTLVKFYLALSLSLPALPVWSQPQTDSAETPQIQPLPAPTASAQGDPLEAAEEGTSPATDEPTPAAPQPKLNIGGRNISAFTRKNLYGGTTVGGYFDTEFFAPEGRSAFFDPHRLILQVSSLLHERIFFNTEIEFEHGGMLGGSNADGELKIEQGYLDFKLEDWLIFRGGVILVPLGRLNVFHDSDFRDTTTRPLFTNIIVPSTWMEPGAGFYGTIYCRPHAPGHGHPGGRDGLS